MNDKYVVVNNIKAGIKLSESSRYYVNDIMDGFDKQKEEVVKNSGYMTQIDEEFKKIVDAVLNNKEIVDELEKIISQFKI